MGAAAAVIRSRLVKEDGDADGVVSDIELLRGLSLMVPGLTPSDAGFLVKFLSSKCRVGGSATGEHAVGTAGLADGIETAAVAEWFTAQPGGVERRKAALDEEYKKEDEPRGSTRTIKLAHFRAEWEAKHGAAARKEAALDEAQPAEGPTWTRAQPEPFRCLHLASAPPTPSSTASTPRF